MGNARFTPAVVSPVSAARASVSLERTQTDDAQAAVLQSAHGTSEAFLVVRPAAAASFAGQLESLFANYAETARQLGLSGDSEVFRRVFLSDAANQCDGYLESRHSRALTGESPIATSIVEEPPLCGKKIVLFAYHQMGAIEKCAVPLARERCRGGVVVRHGRYSDLWLAGLPGAPRPEGARAQTYAAFGALKEILAQHGGTLLDSLIRTWVFVRDIDNHYAGMVAARRTLFADEGLTPATRFVASTGIEGASHAHDALVSLDALAVLGLRREQVIRVEARDHLNPTSEYQVTFERGTKVAYDDRSHVFISGTASIDHRGQILHAGDVVNQTQRTLENIGCLLHDAGAGFGDVTMMIVYLRDALDAAVVETQLSEFLPRAVPRVLVRAPVCRPGWLVEIECIAARPAARADLPSYG